jgi:hypothetical protein
VYQAEKLAHKGLMPKV